jgi:FkbM family methyltransferase
MISRLVRRSVQLVPWRARRRIKNWPIIAGLQRWAVDHLAGRGAFVHTINAGPAKALRIDITLPEDKGLWTGTYEGVVTAALAARVRPGDVCFDVGSYRGFMSGVLALNGAREVVAFEPLPDNIAKIRALVTLNPQLNIRLVAVAIGDYNGEAQFERMAQGSMAKLRRSAFQSDRSGECFTVQMRTLDSLLDNGEISRPDIIKIDVEGAEAAVLRGAQNLIGAHRPGILIEVHSPTLAKECEAILQSHGYTVRWLAREKLSDPGVSHLEATVIDPTLCGA